MTFGAFYFLSFQFFNLVLVLVKLKVLRGFVVKSHHAP
ncbi:putative membrane protein [Helicobacter pylori NQ4110]|uniref:Putative membrane protein n=1 Tax=Helicobacter pylori Hp P-4 TaxID=992075 RepID=J0EWI2_HELPX|nr:putative membrane protein [Helicobacter pylori NQ4110]EJC03639.1 putative membrane protein [Helicobacter pylori Hp P-4]EJC24202.1 putative membrane protein [Helicobacter pylori Hp P-4c]EJC25417.1 putative membrane protein [Helicobacter pylori Hp P-4d]